MSKNIINLDKTQIERIVSESIEKIIQEGCLALPYGDGDSGRNPLNEMARLNKKDGSDSPFPSNKYKIWVQGDNSPHKPAHMHIEYPQEGWQIKVFITNGSLWQVVNFGKRKRTDTFKDVIRSVREWFKLPTTMPGRVGTNQEAALNEWDACNDD